MLLSSLSPGAEFTVEDDPGLGMIRLLDNPRAGCYLRVQPLNERLKPARLDAAFHRPPDPANKHRRECRLWAGRRVNPRSPPITDL